MWRKLGNHWRTNNTVAGITCEKIKEFSLMLRHVLKKVFRFGVCCQISTIVWKQTDDDNFDSQTLSLTLTGWLVVIYVFAPWPIYIGGGPEDPLENCNIQKVCNSISVLFMKILKVSPENRQIGEYLGRWLYFTKPNHPQLTWNIGSCFWGWLID